MSESQTTNSTVTTNGPRFEIQRIYVKEQSCKVPHAPAIFAETEKPEIQFEMNVKHEKIAEDSYQVILALHATSKVNQRTAFILELQQAGVFKLQDIQEEAMKFLLDARCPNILFGYARKIVVDATLEAGFAPLTLAPIDFEGMYAQRQAEEAAKKDKKFDAHNSLAKEFEGSEKIH